MPGLGAFSTARPAVVTARRDLVIVAILISAGALLIWNGSSFFHRLILAEGEVSSSVGVGSLYQSGTTGSRVAMSALSTW